MGGPPIRRKFCQSPPSDTCPRFWTKACPPPAEVRPRKFERFKYIFVSNLTTFKLKSTFKKLHYMPKIAKNGLILHLAGSFGFSQIFFASPPPSDFVPVGDRRGPKILSPPHQKFREKNLCWVAFNRGGGGHLLKMVMGYDRCMATLTLFSTHSHPMTLF